MVGYYYMKCDSSRVTISSPLGIMVICKRGMALIVEAPLGPRGMQDSTENCFEETLNIRLTSICR